MAFGALCILFFAVAVHAGCLFDSLKDLQDQYRETSYADPDFGPKVGVEVEGYIDSKIGRAGVALVMKASIEADHPGLKIRTNFETSLNQQSFLIHYVKNGHDYQWIVKNDVSIHPPTGNVEVELVSPIVRTASDLEEYLSILSYLRALGFKQSPLKAGVHVHVDFFDPSGAELAFLHEVFGELEEELVKTFFQAKTRQVWSGSIRYQRPHIEKARQAGTLSPRTFVSESSNPFESRAISRYLNLNFQSLKLHGTVEFRLFNSTVDREIVEVMVDFSQRLVKAVRTKDPRLMNYIANAPGGKITLGGVAEALGMKLGRSEAILRRIASELADAVNEAKSRSSETSVGDSVPVEEFVPPSREAPGPTVHNQVVLQRSFRDFVRQNRNEMVYIVGIGLLGGMLSQKLPPVIVKAYNDFIKEREEKAPAR